MDTKQPFPQANNTEKVESFGEEKNAGVELWKKRGLEVIARTNVAEDAKQALRAKFTAEFIQNAYKIYSYLPQKTDQDRGNYLIKIGSAASKNAQLQSGDYIVRVDEVPINSLETLQAIYRGKNFLSCKILRNWEIISLDIPITEYNDNEFYAMEVPPILYIADNQILGFTATNTLYSMPDDLIYLQENKIQNDTISLFPGSYLLVCQASGHFSVQYPFMVSCGNTNNEDISLGEPYGEPIFLNMPKYPSNGEEWDSKFCVIPRGFLTSTSPEEQNNMGFLLGRFEVTLGDWYEYLKGVHGPKPWKIEKIQNRIPMLTANKPAFYIRDGELILRGSEMTWPVVGVSYSQVQDYIIWKNQNLPEIQPQMKFRLPTLSEWICAMQGADKRSYPWGNYPNARFAKIATSRPYVTNTEAIHHSNASFILDVSPFGVYGLAGNVSEYTSTFRHYGNMAQYAVKGSAWNDSLLSDIDYVSYVFANLQRNNRGFRLCCGLDPLYHH